MQLMQSTWVEYWYASLEGIFIMVVLFTFAESLRMLIFHSRDSEDPKWGLALVAACIVLIGNAAGAAIKGPWEGVERIPAETAVYVAVPAIFLLWILFVQCIEIFQHYWNRKTS